LAPAFTQSEKLGEAGKAIGALRDYLKWYQVQENLDKVQRHEVVAEQKTDEISQMGMPAVLSPSAGLFQGPNPFAGLLGAGV
jgi:hypothetical protein